MELPTTLQGRPFGPEQLAQIQTLIATDGNWSRYRLSRELARLWDWRTPQGQLKDMAARTLLLKLQRRGWIEMPPQRMKSPTRSGHPPTSEGPGLKPEPVEGALKDLLPLRLREVSQASQKQARRQLEAALHRHHYLGYRSRVGQNLQYWVCDQQERPLGCVVFGAPAWQCVVRDQWIGWNPHQRARHLAGVVNNTRFLLFPKIPTYCYTSSVLGCQSNSVCGSGAGMEDPAWTFATAA